MNLQTVFLSCALVAIVGTVCQLCILWSSVALRIRVVDQSSAWLCNLMTALSATTVSSNAHVLPTKPCSIKWGWVLNPHQLWMHSRAVRTQGPLLPTTSRRPQPCWQSAVASVYRAQPDSIRQTNIACKWLRRHICIYMSSVFECLCKCSYRAINIWRNCYCMATIRVHNAVILTKRECSIDRPLHLSLPCMFVVVCPAKWLDSRTTWYRLYNCLK